MLRSDRALTDCRPLSLISIQSARQLCQDAGADSDKRRFRANVYIDGLPAWDELRWLDRTLAVGDARLTVFARTRRCEATNVDPATAARDMTLPATLSRTWGHSDFGIYAKVATGGTVTVADTISGS